MKVLIVGASVSGLACAESILRCNPSADVTVVDKKVKIGENPRCAGGISLWMAEKIGISIPSHAIEAKIKRLRIYAPNGNYWELRTAQHYGYILNREFFEQDMAERVNRLGGNIVLEQLVTPKELNRWKQFEFIIGADGPVSVVRAWLNLSKLPNRDIHLGFQKIITMEDHPQDTLEIYFGHKVAPEGYAWIFPGGENLVKMGLGIPVWRGYRAHELLKNFIQKHAPKNHKEIGSVAKLIPTGKMPLHGVYGNVLLVGDALPSTDPVTGGGICQGIAAGKAAGRAIGEGAPELYDRYIAWLRKQNHRRYRLKNVLYNFNDIDLNNLIHVMQRFKPKTMSVGKELQRAVIYLLLRKPLLLGKFAREVF